MSDENPQSELPNFKRGELLKRLAKKLINVTGNDKLNRKLSGGGAGRVFNVFDEASQFVLSDLIDGKKLKITGVRDNDDEYFEDENTPNFENLVNQKVEERAQDGLGTSKDILRAIKDQIRDTLGLPSTEELIPDRNVDLIYGDHSDIQKKRHIDDGLQTDLDHELAQKLLRKIEAERVHIFRERGLDSLYIAFGFLEWKSEDALRNKTRVFNSPICLMKVNLETDKKKEKFKISSNGDLEENSDLIEALKQDTGLTPPTLKDFWEEDGKKSFFSLSKFHDSYTHFIRKYKGWKVRNRIAVGIFKSRGIDAGEIDPSNYSDESVDRTEKLLIGSGYTSEPNGFRDVDKFEDRKLVPAFVLPVDSSQHAAILEVAEGRDLVIEGPPGTGKSHTIVNLIANAIHEGKSVLFLAQKVVALDVVYDRLSEKAFGLDKKCIRLYSKHATRSTLYGKAGELSKKMSPVNESQINELQSACLRRDECLTKLNDFAHLMLKEIHGQTYQNIITTSKILSHYILSEEKPIFQLRDSFDLKEKDLDMMRIKEISQILSELPLDSKSLLKTIRCKETDPFKIEELIRESEKLKNLIEPFLAHYRDFDQDSSEAIAGRYRHYWEHRLKLEGAYEKVTNIDTRNNTKDDEIILANLWSKICTNSDIDRFDSIEAKKVSQQAFTQIQSLSQTRLHLEQSVQLIVSLIEKIQVLLPDYKLQFTEDNILNSPQITYPKGLRFFNLQHVQKDSVLIREAKVTVFEINQSVREIREICSEIIMSKELERLGKVIKKLHQRRLSTEDENGQISDLISKIQGQVPHYKLAVSSSNRNSDSNSTYPLELKYFDLNLVKKDCSEINRALSDIQNNKKKKILIGSLSKEYKSSKELLEQYEVLIDKEFSKIFCYLPFSRASKSRKFFQNILKKNSKFKEIRKEIDELIGATQTCETIESNLKKRNLFTSEEKLSSVKNDLEVVIRKVEYQEKLLEELEAEGYLNSSSQEIHKEIEEFEALKGEISEVSNQFLEYNKLNISKILSLSDELGSDPFMRLKITVDKLSIVADFDELKTKSEKLIDLSKDKSQREILLKSQNLCVAEEGLKDSVSLLEEIADKIRSNYENSKVLDSKGYIQKSSSYIESEFIKIKFLHEQIGIINDVSNKLNSNGIKEQDSNALKKLADAFENLAKNLKQANGIATDLDCASHPKSAGENFDFLNSVINSKTSLNKVFAINFNLSEIDKSKGIGGWLRHLFDEEISVENKYKAHLYRHISEKISKQDKEVFQYKQKYYENLKKEFAREEEETRSELAHAIRTNMPTERNIPTTRGRVVSEHRDLGLLQHVTNRNARVTVRELCEKAIDALQYYCKCFFMTPSSVAQYIPRDTTFDLVIIDEASQMLPEEAVGSILRSKQLVVVGDPMQMPPYKGMVTTLFDEEYDDIEEDDGLDKQTSILDLAAETFGDYRRLRYHYRSEDENLIKFSNYEFYENDLITIPNQHEDPNLGVKHFAAEGIYNVGKEGGSKNPNPIEAEKLVDLIIKESREHPNWSLGVAVMNRQQAVRVEEILREKTLNDTKFSKFVSNWAEGSNYFFIKNLENVQGDERDTIIIATVYGRDKDGKAHNRFGPINFNKGENRINVLVTRAKKRVVVCSSMTPNDITSSSRGAQMLRKYLQYSMTGEMDGTSLGHVEDEEHTYDAPWEKWFHDRLEADGFIVDPQVGVSSWRIDLGVKHKDYPAGYICGIELDGPDHLSLSARDRDIERQSILEKKGWTIYRVWSMDFYNDMEGEYQIIKRAVENTLEEKLAKLKIEKPVESEVQIDNASSASPSQILGY